MTTASDTQSNGTAERALVEAIQAAELLVAYAAEQGKQIEKVHFDQIVHSKHIVGTRKLSEEEEAAFWSAYSNLCEATRPVSRESLEATTARPRRRFFFLERNVSEANRAVRYYQGITIVSMLVLLTVQIYWVFVSTIVEDAKKINAEFVDKSVEVTRVSTKLNAMEEAHSKNNGSSGSAAEASADEQLQKLRADSDKLMLEIKQLMLRRDANKELLGHTNLIGPMFQQFGPYIEDEEKDWQIQIQTGAISLDVMSLYLLPILYGLVGACAYILRTLSREIKERTLTAASKIRLQLRMVLGALAGFSIAWFVKAESGGVLESIAPLALAFLAGYSVELLFSAMDTVISAFSRDRTAAPGERSPQG